MWKFDQRAQADSEPHERSRRGITDGLRSFIRADNRSAVDVGHLRRGIRPFHVQKPNFSGDYPEAATREGAYESTLRAEEAKTLKACINIDHIEDYRWGPLLVDADWHAFC